MRAVEDRGGVDGEWKGNDQLIYPSIGILKRWEVIERIGGEHSPSPRHSAHVMHVMIMLLPPQSGGHRDHYRCRWAVAMVGRLGEDYGRREVARRRRRTMMTTMIMMGAASASRPVTNSSTTPMERDDDNNNDYDVSAPFGHEVERG
jgi:hypothetical protein